MTLAAAAQGDTFAPAHDAPGTIALDPVSFAQQRLWLLHHLADRTSAYNTSNVYALDGPLDVAALQAAIDALVLRHESLRTRFTVHDGALMQQVLANGDVPIVVVDCSATGEPCARQLARDEAARPFDLAVGPLLRVRIARLAPTRHWLVVTLHHVVTDRWSQGIFIRELGAFYAAAVEGRPAALAELPVQYADYAIWQREWLQGDVLDAQVDYWRRTLDGLPVLDLPTDRTRPPVASYRGERVHFRLEPTLTAALRDLSRREGATLFMTLLAAYEVLLYRQGGQEDFGVGVPIAGRTRPELEGLIGFFVNTLVMRADLSGSPTFREVLARVKARALDAYAHQDLPFEKLVEELAPRRDASRNPLFQASFAFQNVPRGTWRLPGVHVERVDDAIGHGAKFDLDFAVHEGASALHGTVDFSTDLFDRGTVDGLLAQWQALLAGIVAEPDRCVARLPLMDDATRRTVAALGAGPATAAIDATAATLFAAAVARTPEAIAVDTGTGRLTYRELDAHARELAHHLQGMGAGEGIRVAVCLAPSQEVVVTLLALHKLGAVYVPLEPSHPPARLRVVLDDARAVLLVTTTSQADRLGPVTPAVVRVDTLSAATGLGAEAAPAMPGDPRALAYIAYTSGSTGVPKGVMVEHRSLVNYLTWMADAFPLHRGDRVLVKTSIAFDASLEELLYPLIAGATLVIPPAGSEVLRRFAAIVAREAVTVVQVVPSLLAEWLDHARPSDLATVRLVLCGAEALEPALLARAASLLRGRIVNLYGPTETTVSSTFHVCDASRDVVTVPIGRPIANTVVSVRDAEGEPLPTGVPGELWIAGAGVARGYAGVEAHRGSPFVALPAAGARAYRTGDRVRMRADGALVFLGRVDEQMKLRGVRIEPGDVRAALATHPAVRECEVVVQTGARGEPGLRAYVVLRDGLHGDDVATRLREHLAGQLPGALVPSSFVVIPALPRLASGKLDRTALSAAPPLVAMAPSYAAPTDATETLLCRLWAEVLGVPRVGLDDDFFDLGGHSLLAARLFARQDEALHVAMPLSALFAAPTVRALARRYRAQAAASSSAAGSAGAAGASETIFALASGGQGPRIFAVPGIEGDVIGFADLVRVLGDGYDFYGLQSIGLDGRQSPLDVVEAMAADHLRHIRAIQPQGPYAFLGACFGATVAYEMARQVLADGEDVALLGLLNLTMRAPRADLRVRPLPRPLRRTVDALAFCAARVSLYRREMQGLRTAERLAYLAGKARGTTGTVLRSVATGTPLREMHRQAVHRANAGAMDRYVREPLPRAPREVMALVAGRHGGPEVRAELERLAGPGARVLHQVVPGRDTGDMLADGHAAFVAVHLRAALARAFGTSAAVGGGPA